MPLTTEEIKEAIAIGKEQAHSQQYDMARACHPGIPAWEDLTDDQRARIRVENHRYWKEMHDLGDRVARGEF